MMFADADFSKADLRRSNITEIDLQNANFQVNPLVLCDIDHMPR